MLRPPVFEKPIGFPKAGGLSIQKLHPKSIYLSELLNFPIPVLGQPTAS